MNFSAKHLRSVLGRHQVQHLHAEKRAAVAVLVRFETEGQPEVLLMRRAQCQRDPWSGQVCFPGGKEEAQDASLFVTATRETREELGFDLLQLAEYLGPLPPIFAMAKGKRLSTVIEPFVFLQEQAPQLKLGAEAASTFWLPLRLAYQGNLHATYPYPSKGQTIQLPAWEFQGNTIWGLTYRMLESLNRLLTSDAK